MEQPGLKPPDLQRDRLGFLVLIFAFFFISPVSSARVHRRGVDVSLPEAKRPDRQQDGGRAIGLHGIAQTDRQRRNVATRTNRQVGSVLETCLARQERDDGTRDRLIIVPDASDAPGEWVEPVFGFAQKPCESAARQPGSGGETGTSRHANERRRSTW